MKGLILIRLRKRKRLRGEDYNQKCVFLGERLITRRVIIDNKVQIITINPMQCELPRMSLQVEKYPTERTRLRRYK